MSNACISGLCAQILALRLLDSDDRYDYAVVIGADEQSPFIISGFQCLRALSPEACKPFDSERCGLNLGEAAATIIYGRSSSTNAALVWSLRSGAIRNDANHISGPSRTGEGSWLALMHTLYNIDTTTIAFINAHGTATLYNDEMESIAIERANLLSIPVNSLKGYYGHTMGAAGILETIISMQAIDDHTILGTKNFSSLGVSKPINVCAENKTTDKTAFVKLISGFGGCNAAAYFQKGGTL